MANDSPTFYSSKTPYPPDNRTFPGTLKIFSF